MKEICVSCGIELTDETGSATMTLEYTDRPSVELHLCGNCALKELGIGVELNE